MYIIFHIKSVSSLCFYLHQSGKPCFTNIRTAERQQHFDVFLTNTRVRKTHPAQNSQIDKISNMSLQAESFQKSMSSSSKSSVTFFIGITKGFLTCSKLTSDVSGKEVKNSFRRLTRCCNILDDRFMSKLPSITDERVSNIAKFLVSAFCFQFSSFCANAFRASIKSSTVVSLLCSLRFKRFNWSKISTR